MQISCKMSSKFSACVVARETSFVRPGPHTRGRGSFARRAADVAMAYAGDPDVIDPDPEGKRVFLQGNTWLDHCVEADEFLIRALELIESSDACAADASRDAVLSGLERVRAGVTKRPHETLVKVANGGSVAWARQCADADAAIESALDLFERAPASFRDRPAVVAVADGLHRVRGVARRARAVRVLFRLKLEKAASEVLRNERGGARRARAARIKRACQNSPNLS